MWHDPLDELITDLEDVLDSHPRRFNDHIPTFEELQAWADRTLRRADAAWDGQDPDELDPSFEQEFAAFRAKWPRWFTLEIPKQQ